VSDTHHLGYISVSWLTFDEKKADFSAKGDRWARDAACRSRFSAGQVLVNKAIWKTLNIRRARPLSEKVLTQN
jgi:hypothetical protein